MTPLNLNEIEPSELTPLPDVPESFGPRDEEERRLHTLVKEGIESGPGKQYDSVADLIAELRAAIPRR